MKAAASAFEAGTVAFKAKRFEAAAEQFAHAQELLPHPYTAYNLGIAQRHAGRPVQAWQTFSVLCREAPRSSSCRDGQQQLVELSPSVARIRVDAPVGQAVRIGTHNVAPGEVHVRTPGPVKVHTPMRTLYLSLEGGELRHVELRPGPPAARTRDVGPGPNRAARTATAGAIMFAIGSIATGAAALAVDAGGNPQTTGGRALSYASVGLSAATLTLAVTALVLHIRDQSAARAHP